jgi:O-antigen ligase
MFQKKYLENNYPLILIGLYPLALMLGTFISELITFILISVFLCKSYHLKYWKWTKGIIFYLLITTYLYLIINSILSNFPLESSQRAISFIRFILLVFAINFFFKNNNGNKIIIFKLWFYTLVLTIIDLYFESFFGFNTFGYRSPWSDRLSGFMFGELKIAHLLIGFSLPAIIYYFEDNKNKILFLIFCTLFLIITLLTGERSNGLRCVFIIIFFLIFAKKNILKYKTFIFIFFLIISLTIIIKKPNLNQRYIKEIVALSSENKNFKSLVEHSNYGPHYKTAIEIYKKHTFFGSGIRTFRFECLKKDYDITGSVSAIRCSTHPHNLYLEFLSEMGIFGFICFFTFFIYLIFSGIKAYIKNKNLTLLASLLFILSMLLPLPSGSFFTSFGATIFWVNVAIVYNKINEKIS